MSRDKSGNWFGRHKILSALLALIIIGVIVSISGGGGSKTSDNSNKNSSSSSSSTQSKAGKQYRFTDRADKQKSDIEVLPNEVATIQGVKMTVTNVEYKTSLSDYEKADAGKTYIVATVTLENTSNRTQPYNTLDFRLQTVGGQVLDSTFGTVPSALNSADLVAGGKATGQVLFQVPVETGHQYMIWKPGVASERAIIQVQ